MHNGNQAASPLENHWRVSPRPTSPFLARPRNGRKKALKGLGARFPAYGPERTSSDARSKGATRPLWIPREESSATTRRQRRRICCNECLRHNSPLRNPADALPKLAPQVLPTHGQLRAEAGVSRSQRACAHLKSICPLSAQPVFAMVAKTRPARHCEARAAHFVESKQIARRFCRRQLSRRAWGRGVSPRVLLW